MVFYVSTCLQMPWQIVDMHNKNFTHSLEGSCNFCSKISTKLGNLLQIILTEVNFEFSHVDVYEYGWDLGIPRSEVSFNSKHQTKRLKQDSLSNDRRARFAQVKQNPNKIDTKEN